MFSPKFKQIQIASTFSPTNNLYKTMTPNWGGRSIATAGHSVNSGNNETTMNHTATSWRPGGPRFSLTEVTHRNTFSKN